MRKLKRITNDELVIAILSLWYGIPADEIERICNELHRDKAEPPGQEKKIPELERIAKESVNPCRK